MKIESTDQDIRTLLSSAFYRIPRFQRPYSWDKENVQDLWDDVVKDGPEDYFIGSMVVYETGKQHFGIVDGQQRLTTITILLCVLRDNFASLECEDLAKGIQSLIERRNIDNKLEFVLSTETSYPFLQDGILKWGGPEVRVTPHNEERALQAAYDQLTGLVKAVVESVNTDSSVSSRKKPGILQKKLVQIRDALLDLKLIAITLDNEDDAYLIFETLNTRGKDLGLSDLVKNHLTKLLKARRSAVDAAKLTWQQIPEIIEGSSVELETGTFIHHYWLSKYDYLAEKKLFKELKRRITKTNAKEFLDSLRSDAEIYRSIHETDFGKWDNQDKRIREALDALMLFKVRQQTPCVLALVREYKGRRLKRARVEEALVAIEKFHFLFTAVTSQRSSGGISTMYASLARRLSEARDRQGAVSVIKDLKKKLRKRIPSLEEVRALFPKLLYTDNLTKQKKLVKYMLSCFHKASRRSEAIDCSSMTIEHLVPQSLIAQGTFSDQIIGQAGNLILVTDELNTKLKNKSFKQKKNILIDAGYRLDSDIQSATDWTANDIEARTLRMADEAYNSVWRI